MKKLNTNKQIRNIKKVASCLWHFKGKKAFEKVIEKIPSNRYVNNDIFYIIKDQKKICEKSYLSDFKKI